MFERLLTFGNLSFLFTRLPLFCRLFFSKYQFVHPTPYSCLFCHLTQHVPLRDFCFLIFYFFWEIKCSKKTSPLHEHCMFAAVIAFSVTNSFWPCQRSCFSAWHLIAHSSNCTDIFWHCCLKKKVFLSFLCFYFTQPIRYDFPFQQSVYECVCVSTPESCTNSHQRYQIDSE